MSRAADWGTGRNCRLSDDTVALRAGLLKPPLDSDADCQRSTASGRQAAYCKCADCKAAHAARRTVLRARNDLEAEGFIERTGQTRNNVLVYRLTFPATTCDTRVTTTCDTNVTTEAKRLRHQSPTVVTPKSNGCDTKVTQPPSTPLDQEEDEEENAAKLPVSEIIPSSWTGHVIMTTDTDLRQLLGQLQAAGWTSPLLRQFCATLPKPHTNPTGLLVKHLSMAIDLDPTTLVTRVEQPSPALCKHDVPADGSCVDCRADDAPTQDLPSSAPWEKIGVST